MSNLPVTLVTQNASQDAVTDAVYLDILKSLIDVDGRSFQWIADKSEYASKAWWNLRYHGKRPFDEESKNALRRLSEEFPQQPPSVTSVTDSMVDPDAAMYLVGALEPGERVRRVLMLADSGAITVHANGTVEAYIHPNETLHPVTPTVEAQGAKQEQRRHRLTVAPDDYEWMQQNGYQSVSDMIKKLREATE
jgi:hypothetical protein